MGLNYNGIRVILYAKNLGVDFSLIAMIGRQNLHLPLCDFRKCQFEFEFMFDEDILSKM